MNHHQLQDISGSNSLSHPILQRGQNDLTCISRQTNTASANSNQMRLTGLAVGKWPKRYRGMGQECLHNE
jgi:hypothetical protein